jgi:hypothetical protein
MVCGAAWIDTVTEEKRRRGEEKRRRASDKGAFPFQASSYCGNCV